MKKKIKITQKELRNIIKESVNNLLTEMDWRSYEEFAKRAKEESEMEKNPYIQRKRKEQAKNFADMADKRRFSQYNLNPDDFKILNHEPKSGVSGYNPKYEKERRRVMRAGAQQYDDTNNYFGGKSMYKDGKWITPSDEEKRQMEEREKEIKKIEQNQLRQRESDEKERMLQAQRAREEEQRRQEEADNKRRNSLSYKFKNLFKENVNEVSFNTIRDTNKKMRQYGQTQRGENLLKNYKKQYTHGVKGWTIAPNPEENIIKVSHYYEGPIYRFDIERDEWIDGKLPRFNDRVVAKALVDVISSINPDSYFANKNFYIM